MSFHRTSSLNLAVICGVLFSGAALHAQDAQPADTQEARPADSQAALPPADTQPALPVDTQAAITTPFAVSIQKGEAIGSEQILRVKITASTNEFVFVVPRGLNLRVDASYPGKIIISKTDCTYFMTIRLIQGHLCMKNHPAV